MTFADIPVSVVNEPVPEEPEVNTMGFDEKADAMKDKVSGKVKEGAGKATGDSRTEAEGKGENLKGKAKEGLTDAKDKAKGFGDSLKNN